jgi:hypothetical protein
MFTRIISAVLVIFLLSGGPVDALPQATFWVIVLSLGAALAVSFTIETRAGTFRQTFRPVQVAVAAVSCVGLSALVILGPPRWANHVVAATIVVVLLLSSRARWGKRAAPPPSGDQNREGR